jgi:hypothetical protein
LRQSSKEKEMQVAIAYRGGPQAVEAALETAVGLGRLARRTVPQIRDGGVTGHHEMVGEWIALLEPKGVLR